MRRHTTTSLVVCLALALAACSDGDEAGDTRASATTGTSTTAAPSRAPSTAREYDFSKPETVASNLDVPWGLAFLPEGSALVAERESGRIFQIGRGARPKEVMRLDAVEAGGEGGLLGLAVSPGYAEDALVYAYYTAARDNRVVRFRLGGDEEVIVPNIERAGNHNGGRLAFGPDGFLYVATGDAGDPSSSQDPASLNGKILRVAPDGTPAPGNPTAGSRVWSLGHRNVQGLAWDGSGRLFATEFGQNRFDEVNLIEPGKNYGWPEVEGKGGGRRFVEPLVTWRTFESSPSGAAIAGANLYVAALRGERLWVVPVTDAGLGKPRAVLAGELGRLRTVAVAPDGALWVTTSNTDGRGDPEDKDDLILRFPPIG